MCQHIALGSHGPTVLARTRGCVLVGGYPGIGRTDPRVLTQDSGPCLAAKRLFRRNDAASLHLVPFTLMDDRDEVVDLAASDNAAERIAELDGARTKELLAVAVELLREAQGAMALDPNVGLSGLYDY